MSSTMEALTILENGNAPQRRKPPRFQEACYPLIFGLIAISALVPIVFCLLHHRQAPGPCWAHGYLKKSSTETSTDIMRWDWKLEHCSGSVKEQEGYLIIEQSGNYFIYAQLYRIEKTETPFTLKLYKEPSTTLNTAVGPENGTVNFARPFFLEKGDKLYCRMNDISDKLLLRNQTYWGLYKM